MVFPFLWGGSKHIPPCYCRGGIKGGGIIVFYKNEDYFLIFTILFSEFNYFLIKNVRTLLISDLKIRYISIPNPAAIIIIPDTPIDNPVNTPAKGNTTKTITKTRIKENIIVTKAMRDFSIGFVISFSFTVIVLFILWFPEVSFITLL